MANTIITLKNITFTYPETEKPVIEKLSLHIPAGVTSIMGQNGTGKSTVMLIAAGRIIPQEGETEILGKNTREFTDENQRNEYCSFIYQNMEFETEETIEELLNFVYQQGFHKDKKDGLVDELITVFELEEVRGKKIQELSKGGIQRAVIAFSLLYGSKIIIMDEPIFALEDNQKHKVMHYLVEYAQKYQVSILYSVHEFEITQKYSDNMILVFKASEGEGKRFKVGPTKELFAREILEDAYQVPFASLHQKEHLYREHLMTREKLRKAVEKKEEN